MFLTVLLAIAALAISTVAAYFSVAGLAVVFAASAIPIILMGAAVEAGKIIAVAWTHYNWAWTSRRLRAGLCTAILIAMVLTSVGVFGFLSKAHVEQTALGTESVAQVVRIETEVLRMRSIIERAENKIIVLESSGSTADTTIQTQIDNEQQRIDSAALRLQPAIDEQNAIIAGQTRLYQKQIDALDAELDQLQKYIDDGEVKKAQQLLGETSIGGWGPLTAETARLWKLERTTEKSRLYAKIEDISQNNTAILAARKEISRLRQASETQLAESNTLINRLRSKIGNDDTTNVDELLDEQYKRISDSNKSIGTLTDEKYVIEAEFRQLEADVGPIKYIAEFVYRENADADLLERAVQWMIILLLLVLDPFAVLLVIAATDGWRWNRDAKKKKFDDDVASGAIQFIEKEVEKIVEVPVQVEKIVEVPVQVEKIVEVPVEVEKIVEKIVEVPVEIEKIVEVNNIDSEYVEELETALETISQQRDDLQLDLTQMGFDLEIVQKEIEKVPLLEQEVKKLTSEAQISARAKHTINIQAPGNEASLRHKVKLLTDRITSMKELSDFDIESAQELVEVKQQKAELEQRLEALIKNTK